MFVGSIPVAATKTSDIASVSSKDFLDIQATTECRFTLKCVCDMIRTHSQYFIINLRKKAKSIYHCHQQMQKQIRYEIS